MPTRPRATCAAILGLLLGSASARAQSVSLSRAGSGARAAGMGDAYIAVSDDGTAASWNPAGLAHLRLPELSLVYVVSDRGQRFEAMRSPDLSVAYSTQRFHFTNSSLDFASAAMPFSIARKPMTVQLGWHRLYQLSEHLSADIDRHVLSGPSVAPTTISKDASVVGDIDHYSVAWAVKLTSRTAVGASANFWRGGWTDRVSLTEETGEPGSAAFFSSNSRLRLRGRNVSVGLLLTYPSWNVGLVYHAPFWSALRITNDLRSSRGNASGAAPEARFRLPRSIGVGVARRFAPRWTTALSVTHDQWTGALLDRLPREPGPVSLFDGVPPELSSARDTVSLNAGLEHLHLREGGAVVPLRLGAGWEPQGDVDPVTRDPIGFILLTAGAGYNTNQVKIDAAVQYRWGAAEVSEVYSVDTFLEDDPARDAIGRATHREWRIKVSAIYRIPDTEKLRQVVRRIFG